MTKNNLIEILKVNPLFMDLPEPALSAFAGGLKTQTCQKNQYLFFQGDLASSAFLVIRGQGLLESISLDGGQLSFDKLIPGSFFGEFALLDDGPRSTSAVATTTMSLISIPKPAFMRLISEHPVFAMTLIKRLVRLMRHADSHLESLQFKNLEQRLAHFLVREYLRGSSDNYSIELTQVDIARSLSASREKVNKAIQCLKEKGMIHTSRGSVKILILEGLKGVYSDI